MSVRPNKRKDGSIVEGSWIIDFYPHGRKSQKRFVYEGTEEQARKAEQSLRIQSREKSPPLLYPAIAETIPEYMRGYRLDHQPEGAERTNRSIKILLGFFGKYQFPSITEELVEIYKERRLKQVKHTTINKELAALSGLMKWARKKGYCKSVPRIERFPLKLTAAPFPKIPSQEAIETLIAAVPWPKQGILYCLYYGGLRRQEACTLKAEDVNISQRTMYIRGKGGKYRVVPILRYLLPILEKRIQEKPSGYLWATEKSGNVLRDLRETIQWALKRSGVKEHITPHSLRHAFGVRAVMAGIHLRTIQIILGHSSSKVTEIYTRLATGQILQDVEKF